MFLVDVFEFCLSQVRSTMLEGKWGLEERRYQSFFNMVPQGCLSPQVVSAARLSSKDTLPIFSLENLDMLSKDTLCSKCSTTIIFVLQTCENLVA